MIVKFFRRGKGSGAGPLNYLLVTEGKPREGAKVLYGDPKLTEQLINATPYQQKYKSGVLSFTEDANKFSDEQKKDIMQRFEDTLFIGLEPDQYDILWVEHSDKGGRLELNFVIPCQELRSGKSLQPFYAQSDLVRVNAFKNIINKEYELTDPNEPQRKRLINPYVTDAPRPTPYNPKKKKKEDKVVEDTPNTQAIKADIDRQALDSLKEGTLNNRSSVMGFLQGLGFTLERVTEKSISISRPDLKRNIRLKGAIYANGFKGLSQRPEIIESMQEDYERVSDSRGIRDLMTWEKGMEMKKEYHQKRYGDIDIPAPLDLNDMGFTDKVAANKGDDITKEEYSRKLTYSSPRP
uniref:relaxase/mobilization nuclease domain-containing protein n=1 Tax=Psychrobacter sp. TaxID=56811 RepID=UPI001598E677|nr:relaxase/mobilization nuclease domain-containing protein [Psychrobacter sp.]QJS05686.1 mobilization nuclease, MobA [Psychrobacter sp.]